VNRIQLARRLGYATAMGVLAFALPAYTQPRDETADVLMANQAFHAALSALDVAAMDKVWAHEDCVAYIGPFHRSVAVGWPTVKAELQANRANVEEISVKPIKVRVRINGDTAWIFGKEEGAALPKVGISVFRI
jgi:hypothetical protein